mgnify:CR=1 FL=1
MRPTESYSKFINMWPRNPVQSAFRRFAVLPSSEIRSAFSDSAADFQKKMTVNDRLKTSYSDLWGGDS